MDSYAQSRVYLEDSALDNHLACSTVEDGAPSMKIHTYGAAVLSASTAGDFSLIANTQPCTPSFTTCGHGDHKYKGKGSTYLWTCCNCKHSGMSVASTECCPVCYNYRCDYCETYKGKSSR